MGKGGLVRAHGLGCLFRLLYRDSQQFHRSPAQDTSFLPLTDTCLHTHILAGDSDSSCVHSLQEDPKLWTLMSPVDGAVNSKIHSKPQGLFTPCL